MAKKIQLKVISLGSEPGVPTVADLTGFIRQSRGIDADLLTFQLLRSLSAQKNAGIDEPACGGSFYRPKMEEGLSWDEEMGPLVHPETLMNDYALLVRQGGTIRSVHESPAVLSSAPTVEDEDAFAELFHGFRQILRMLRDHHISGHVIHLDNPASLEIELLSTQKSLLFLRNPTVDTLSDLLEHTRDLILPAGSLPLLDHLMDRYQVRTLSVCGMNEQALSDALQYVDPDHLKIAGYGDGNEEAYWKKVKDAAVMQI